MVKPRQFLLPNFRVIVWMKKFLDGYVQRATVNCSMFNGREMSDVLRVLTGCILINVLINGTDSKIAMHPQQIWRWYKVVQLIQSREGVASRGTWLAWGVGSRESQRLQVRGLARGVQAQSADLGLEQSPGLQQAGGWMTESRPTEKDLEIGVFISLWINNWTWVSPVCMKLKKAITSWQNQNKHGHVEGGDGSSSGLGNSRDYWDDPDVGTKMMRLQNVSCEGSLRDVGLLALTGGSWEGIS